MNRNVLERSVLAVRAAAAAMALMLAMPSASAQSIRSLRAVSPAFDASALAFSRLEYDPSPWLQPGRGNWLYLTPLDTNLAATMLNLENGRFFPPPPPSSPATVRPDADAPLSLAALRWLWTVREAAREDDTARDAQYQLAAQDESLRKEMPPIPNQPLGTREGIITQQALGQNLFAEIRTTNDGKQSIRIKARPGPAMQRHRICRSCKSFTD